MYQVFQLLPVFKEATQFFLSISNFIQSKSRADISF